MGGFRFSGCAQTQAGEKHSKDEAGTDRTGQADNLAAATRALRTGSPPGELMIALVTGSMAGGLRCLAACHSAGRISSLQRQGETLQKWREHRQSEDRNHRQARPASRQLEQNGLRRIVAGIDQGFPIPEARIAAGSLAAGQV